MIKLKQHLLERDPKTYAQNSIREYVEGKSRSGCAFVSLYEILGITRDRDLRACDVRASITLDITLSQAFYIFGTIDIINEVCKKQGLNKLYSFENIDAARRVQDVIDGKIK